MATRSWISLWLPGMWALGVATVVWAGFLPDGYLMRMMPPPHPYPLTVVLWAILFMTLLTGGLYAVLRPRSYRRSWGRALCATVLTIPFVFQAAVSAMHAPPPVGYYIYWTMLMCVGCAVLCLCSGVAALWARGRV